MSEGGCLNSLDIKGGFRKHRFLVDLVETQTNEIHAEMPRLLADKQ